MAISIKHAFASAKGDGSDATFVQPSHWNQPHATTMAAGNLLGRLSPGAGVFEEIPISAFMAGLLASADYNALAARLGLFVVGDLKFSITSAVPAGWILYQASYTMGKTGSGATYAGDIYWPLFAVIWTYIDQAYAPVGGGKGGAALTDWDAGKLLTLPQFGGRPLLAAGASAGASSRPAGYYAGAETHTLTTAELASHRHTAGLYNPGHYHQYTETYAYTTGTREFDSHTVWNTRTQNTGGAIWNGDPNGLRIYSSDGGMDTTYLAGSNSAHNNMQPHITMWLHIKL